MPRGVPNTKTTALEPLIIIQPAADGSLHLNAYQLEDAEVVAMLRKTLLHLVATLSGARVIDLTVPAQAAVTVEPLRVPRAKAPAKAPMKGRPGPKPAQRSSNGRQDAGLHRISDQAEPDDDELDEIDLRELMEER